MEKNRCLANEQEFDDNVDLRSTVKVLPSEGLLVDVGVTVSACYLFITLAVCAWIDLSRLVIPNLGNAALLAGAAVFTWISPHRTSVDATLGAVIGAGLFLSVALTFRYARGHEGLGLGDVKFMAGAGAWVGWQGVAPLILVASVSALIVVAGTCVVQGTFDPRKRWPFAPFLGVATALVWSLQTTQVGSWLLNLT